MATFCKKTCLWMDQALCITLYCLNVSRMCTFMSTSKWFICLHFCDSSISHNYYLTRVNYLEFVKDAKCCAACAPSNVKLSRYHILIQVKFLNFNLHKIFCHYSPDRVNLFNWLICKFISRWNFWGDEGGRQEGEGEYIYVSIHPSIYLSPYLSIYLSIYY